MTRPSELLADSRGDAPRRLDRGGAYRAARRHSARVRLLRWAIPLGCLLAVGGLVGVMVFDPFSKVLPGNISIGSLGLNGTRVTMELPKLSGYRQDGRRYDVRAASGVQDIKVPNVIELNQMDATFETSDANRVRVLAPLAIYDSGKEFMEMRGDVRVTSASGFDIRMRNADVDMKAGSIRSQEPVHVIMPRGTVDSDRIDIANGGQQVTFDGNVVTVLVPAETEAGPASKRVP
jgi:lipopolysaccharide export system protein LptC